MKNSMRFTAAILLSMFLFGCGQSGPLYVSGNPSAVQVPSADTADEDVEEEAASTDE